MADATGREHHEISLADKARQQGQIIFDARIVEAKVEGGSLRPDRAFLLRAYLEALESGDAAPAARSGG